VLRTSATAESRAATLSLSMINGNVSLSHIDRAQLADRSDFHQFSVDGQCRTVNIYFSGTCWETISNLSCVLFQKSISFCEHDIAIRIVFRMISDISDSNTVRFIF
jgi:hypothetical protein